MRKSQKKWIEETIALMGEAHEEIRRRLAEQNGDMVRQLLGSCQESAIQIGRLIEETEGEDAPSVESLEKYCEVCWHVYEETEQGNMQNPSGIYRFLQKQLTDADNRIRQTVPTRLEIAFFCYKASMSDSLESIYFAAKADPECDAYFIPIPYYDRGPDGTLGAMYYEGEGYYPDTYGLTDWREYDVEARRPDIIYIMNPYDDKNYVTSVHPDFYARRLKDMTDCLVYVPYYVSVVDPRTDLAALPGVVNAELVFVQSDHVRDIYVENFLKVNDIPGMTLKTAREKFIAMGSPKLDRIWDIRREDYLLPEQWQSAVDSLKPGQRILLYNLTIVGALNAQQENGETYLRKVKSVLEFFKNYRDILLWLRPHPLLAQTLHTMRPWLAEEYKKIIQDYKKEGWGIYDDTANLDRAIAWADACFGDRSSIELLLEFAGKPVLIQNIESVGESPLTVQSADEVREIMEEFIQKDQFNTYVMFEAGVPGETGQLSMNDFCCHLDVILEYSAGQMEKIRRKCANSDGTAGRKIHEYAKLRFLEKFGRN